MPRIMNTSPWHQPHLKADRKSTRLNSSHSQISYAVFCLKKKYDTDCHSSTKLLTWWLLKQSRYTIMLAVVAPEQLPCDIEYLARASMIAREVSPVTGLSL